jgi:hypothetical protein
MNKRKTSLSYAGHETEFEGDWSFPALTSCDVYTMGAWHFALVVFSSLMILSV